MTCGFQLFWRSVRLRLAGLERFLFTLLRSVNFGTLSLHFVALSPTFIRWLLVRLFLFVRRKDSFFLNEGSKSTKCFIEIAVVHLNFEGNGLHSFRMCIFVVDCEWRRFT